MMDDESFVREISNDWPRLKFPGVSKLFVGWIGFACSCGILLAHAGMNFKK